MNLNGQCEKAFNEWLEHPDNSIQEGRCVWIGESDATLYNIWTTEYFYQLPHEMQHGVKVKFFDSVGIFIEVKVKSPFRKFNYGIHDENDWIISSSFFETREEAETKAEQKANHIYNENN